MKFVTVLTSVILAGVFANAQGEPAPVGSGSEPQQMEQSAPEKAVKEKKEKKHKKKSVKSEEKNGSEK